MDRYDLTMITAGYRERIRRLALFDPLSDLERKREKDHQGHDIDMKGFGLLALLFFFEQKVMRKTKTGKKELATFIQQMTEDQYELEAKDYHRLADSLIKNFRPDTGVKRHYTFFNWETKQEEVLSYAILKTNDFDQASNEQYYTLTDDGLELVFATKEFYSEFQLSINQLMLRKQLERGEFNGALRQINEMRVSVEQLEDNRRALKQDIQRSIVSEEIFDRYQAHLEDSYNRLRHEDDEFKELREFVKETKDRLYAKDTHQKEEKTYDLILTITRELESVHHDHSRLLEQTIELKNTTLITAQESLYYTGIEGFNFDHEITSRMISVPLPLETMEGIMHPFLSIEEERIWSPFSLFQDQTITDKDDVKQRSGMLEASTEPEDDHESEERRLFYKEIMEALLTCIGDKQEIKLSDFLDYLTETERAKWYTHRPFYDFWIFVHQRSPLTRDDTDDDSEGKTLFSEALGVLGDDQLMVEETADILNRYKRYSIQNMRIKLEER